MSPRVFEELFNFLPELLGHGLLDIELLDSAEEFTQVITILKSVIESLEIIQDLNKVAHDVGEDGYSKEKQEGANTSFQITPRVEITKANGRKRSKGKVHREYDDLFWGIFVSGPSKIA